MLREAALKRISYVKLTKRISIYGTYRKQKYSNPEAVLSTYWTVNRTYGTWTLVKPPELTVAVWFPSESVVITRYNGPCRKQIKWSANPLHKDTRRIWYLLSIQCCGTVTIYCVFGSDFVKVPVPDPNPEPYTENLNRSSFFYLYKILPFYVLM